MLSPRSRSPVGQTGDLSAATLVGDPNDEEKSTKSYQHRPPLRDQHPVGETVRDAEIGPLTDASGNNPKTVEDEPPLTPDSADRKFHWLPEPLRWLFVAPRPFSWLFVNATITFLWGVALAVFCAGKVPWHWNISQFLNKYNREWTNEIAALVGSLCKLHVAYVLQQALELYSHVVIAGEFTLQDLKWMQGVNEETIFAKFPDRPGAPPRSVKPRGCWGRVKGWWWLIRGFCHNLRLLWIVIWLGLLLHNTAIVSILQPEEFWKHVEFNDGVPCGINASTLTLGKEQFLSDDQQQVLDKMSYEIGLQLGNYVDQVCGNTTTAVAGRKYRKDNFAYGGIGGLVEGLQDIPGVQYAARCTTSVLEANATWSLALPGVIPPTISPSWSEFTNLPALPDTLRSVESHSPPSFKISFFESAMYGVVDPLGNGAFITLSLGAKNEPPLPLICSWNTTPKLLHIEMVNFTALVLGHEPADVYPSLVGRSTWETVIGMARASRLGANIQPDALHYWRHNVTGEWGPSYDVPESATIAQIVETILADGGKASMAKYNILSKPEMRTQSGGTMSFCNSNNKTVQEHWRFGNKEKVGWIAVVWTIGVGIIGMWAAVWMSRKGRLDGVSPLGAAGGFVLAVGENIPDDRPLVVRHGKVVYKV